MINPAPTAETHGNQTAAWLPRWFAQYMAIIAFVVTLYQAAYPSRFSCDSRWALFLLLAPVATLLCREPQWLLHRTPDIVAILLRAILLIFRFALFGIGGFLFFQDRALFFLCFAWWLVFMAWLKNRPGIGWLAPALGLLLAGLLWFAVPLRVSFWLHKPGLERLLDGIQDHHQDFPEPRRVGIYPIFMAGRWTQEAFLWTHWSAPRPPQYYYRGFGYRANGAIPAGDRDRAILDLGAGWYAEAKEER